jgi:hypothetical protein
MTLENLIYMQELAKRRALAERLYPNLSEAQRDLWAHHSADMIARGKHLLAGGQWSRGPTVLK